MNLLLKIHTDVKIHLHKILQYTYRPVADFSIVDTGCGEVTYTPTNNSQNDVVKVDVTPNTNVSIINPNDQQPSITFPKNTSQKEILLYTL